jgi:predicted RNase H-like nuclease (RuvC/YqgF family)
LKGFDLADFLIMQDWVQYRKKSNEYSGITSRIESIRKAIKEDQNRIEFLRNELPTMESTFIQVAKDLPIQWFDKSNTGKIQPTNRLSLIKYWCE